MTRIASALSFLSLALGPLVYATAADAQSARTWVSGGGNDSNLCTRIAPCATFAAAYANTAAGGEIDVLDGGDFGHVSINKAITIANDGAGTAAITLASGGVGVNINVGATDTVVLRGLSIIGVNADYANGIAAQGGGSLVIDHCRIQGFGFDGILVTPYGGSSGKLSVKIKDTVLLNDGTAGHGGLEIQPTAVLTTIILERVQILNAIGNGVRADARFGPVDVELHDVTVDAASGGAGIVAVSQTFGGPPARILADNVTSSHNAGYGFRAVGPTASIYLSRSTITDNDVGIGASGGAAIVSYGDNRFAGNTGGDGVAPTPIGLK